MLINSSYLLYSFIYSSTRWRCGFCISSHYILSYKFDAQFFTAAQLFLPSLPSLPNFAGGRGEWGGTIRFTVICLKQVETINSF